MNSSERWARAFGSIPARVWWIICTPVIFALLFLVDRHLGMTSLFVGMVVLGLTFPREKSKRQTIKRSNDFWINPSTGMMMDSAGGVDSSGYLFGEDTSVDYPDHS
jgi:hypothetical protein